MTSEATTTANSLTKALILAGKVILAIGVIWGALVGIKTFGDNYIDSKVEAKTHATKNLLKWFLHKNPEAAKEINAFNKDEDCLELILDGKICK